MYNRNAAYDVEIFEELQPRKGRILKLPNTKQQRHNQKIQSRAKFIVSSFSVFAVASFVVSMFIFGQAQLTVATDKVEKLSHELNQQTSISTQLDMKLKSKMSESATLVENSENTEFVLIPRV